MKALKFLCVKALKAFIKSFEAPQRSVKMKIEVNFFLFVQDRGGKGKFLFPLISSESLRIQESFSSSDTNIDTIYVLWYNIELEIWRHSLTSTDLWTRLA